MCAIVYRFPELLERSLLDLTPRIAVHVSWALVHVIRDAGTMRVCVQTCRRSELPLSISTTLTLERRADRGYTNQIPERSIHGRPLPSSLSCSPLAQSPQSHSTCASLPWLRRHRVSNRYPNLYPLKSSSSSTPQCDCPSRPEPAQPVPLPISRGAAPSRRCSAWTCRRNRNSILLWWMKASTLAIVLGWRGKKTRRRRKNTTTVATRPMKA